VEIGLKAKSATIQVSESFECGYYPKGSAAPKSNFIRGHLAGGLSHLFGTRMEVNEVACISKGDKYCVFEAKPAANSSGQGQG